MRNGPVLWERILSVAREVGTSPIIAGGAVRDYVMKLGNPKDIDVFIGGSPPDEMQLPEDWSQVAPGAGGEVHGEYRGQVGTITALQDWRLENVREPIQFIWIGDNDPVQYVRGFDLGTSKCYYRGSVVLGKDFLTDWHHQQISILPVAFQRGRNVERSRERARRLAARHPDGAAINEMSIPQEPWVGEVPPNVGAVRVVGQQVNLQQIPRDVADPWNGWGNALGVAHEPDIVPAPVNAVVNEAPRPHLDFLEWVRFMNGGAGQA